MSDSIQPAEKIHSPTSQDFKWENIGLAILAVGLGAAARALLFLVLGSRLPFLTFFPAIIFAALYGGRIAGLTATFLSAFASTFWMESLGGPLGNTADLVGLGLFIVTSVIIVWLCEKSRRNQLRAESVALEQAKLATIVASSDDAIISKTLDGVVFSWNAAAQKVFGYSADEMIGQPILKLIPPDRLFEEEDILSRIRRGEQIDHYETVRRRKDGSLIDVMVTISPMRNAKGEIVGASKIARDVTQKRRADRALRLSEARSSGILEASLDSIVSMDSNGLVVEWNPAAERTFGYTRAEAIGKLMAELIIPPALREMHRAGLARFVETGDGPVLGKRLELSAVRKDGSEFPVELAITRIAVDGPAMFTGHLRDITQRKNAEAERDKLLESEQIARAEAERANHLKDEFLATLSHELRTPLNAILGWAQLLSNGELKENDLTQGLETIQRNARIQSQLIEDLLDMSRILSGKVRLDVQRVELVSVIETAIETVLPSANAKDIRIHKMLDPRASAITGDPNRLQQILWNLLNNAVKFTPKGGRIQVLLERVNSHIEISVSDTGVGIDLEFLPHVFERFRQADASTVRAHGGLGLGLAIVKHLLEMHGGSIRAKSGGSGKGSTFIVSLPLRIVDPHDSDDSPRNHPTTAPQIGLTGNRPSLAGVKALVVDDEPDALILVRRLLEDANAEVTTAASAAEAIQLVRDSRPHVLISDIGMPGKDGYSLMREVRAMESGGSRLPAVALTAFARAEDRLRALNAGFQMHVAKPVDPLELLTVVASVVDRVQMPNAS